MQSGAYAQSGKGSLHALSSDSSPPLQSSVSSPAIVDSLVFTIRDFCAVSVVIQLILDLEESGETL